MANGSSTAYDVFDTSGARTGTIPVTTAGAVAGDVTGGWIMTDIDRVTHVDATGGHPGSPLVLPTGTQIAGLAVGEGSLWVADIAGPLSRINPSTGQITGTVDVASVGPLQVVVTRGAAFVAGKDYSISRSDASSMKVTAVVNWNPAWSYADLAVADNGDLWAVPAKGALVQLDAATLSVKRFLSVFPNNRGGGNFGLAITHDRAFISDGDTRVLHSFPLS